MLNAMKLNLEILITNSRAFTTPHSTNNDLSTDLTILTLPQRLQPISLLQ